ncbi:hypothetical protein BY458DRAFT_524342 [Sporodiniella umbellata]|nr:hypothetical protein BY458DRAFT_524342 [Sporodiniella umbellata]
MTQEEVPNQFQDDKNDEEKYVTAPSSPSIEQLELALDWTELSKVLLKASNSLSDVFDVCKPVPSVGHEGSTSSSTQLGSPDDLELKKRKPKTKKPYYLLPRQRTGVIYSTYIADHLGVNDIRVDPNQTYPSFSKEWRHIKRHTFFRQASSSKRNSSICIECRMEIRKNTSSLQALLFNRRHRAPLCDLCERLFERFASLDQEIEVMHYLLFGEVAPHENVNFNPESKEIRKACERRATILQSRIPDRKNDVDTLTGAELTTLSYQTQMRCAITYAPTYLPSTGGARYWKMSVDLVSPFPEGIRKRYQSKNPLCIDNVQIVCQLIFMIKRDSPNEEIVEWWKALRSTQIDN